MIKVYHIQVGLSSLLGKINKIFFFDFYLDKLLELWYTRNSGEAARQGRDNHKNIILEKECWSYSPRVVPHFYSVSSRGFGSHLYTATTWRPCGEMSLARWSYVSTLRIPCSGLPSLISEIIIP
jgi:hypothetical protein